MAHSTFTLAIQIGSWLDIWHVDPEKRGDEDSCDWFNRKKEVFRIHPRWHVWHWRLQIIPIRNLKRYLFGKCENCGRGFKWGYAPLAHVWNGGGPKWFRSEPHITHHRCPD